MTTSNDAVTRRLLEIADRTNRRVTQQGTRLDAHERELAGHRQVARTVVGQTADIARVDGRLVEISEELAQTSGRAEMAASAAVGAHDRLDDQEEQLNRHENWLNRLDGKFPWPFWGGISAVTFLVSMLFWRVLIYGANVHPWAGGDRGGPEWWQRHQPGTVSFAWWVWVIVTTVAISGIAWIVLSLLGHRDRENNNADGSAEPANVAQTDPVNPTTAPIEAPEPPPVVDEPTSVFEPGQQTALR